MMLLLQLITRLRDEDNHSGALRLANRAVKRFPDDPRPWRARGALLHSLGQFRRAVGDLECGRRLGPLAFTEQFVLADSYRQWGRRRRALQAGRRLLAHPDCPIPILAKLATHFGLLVDYAEALAACERIVEAAPTAHPAWFGIGYYRARLGFSAAQIVPFVEKAHDLDPALSTYSANLALLYWGIGDDGRAREIVDRVEPPSLRCPCLVSAVVESLEERGEQAIAERWRTWRDLLAERCIEAGVDFEARSRAGCCAALPIERTPCSGRESDHEPRG